MARPREFDADQALDQAMHLFWEKGYEATSMRDLVERTGVHRGSLYATFGNKEKIFSAVLDRYAACAGEPVARELLGSDRPIAAFKRLMRRRVEEYANGEHLHGCLMANAAAEIGPDDPTLYEKNNRMVRWREEFLYDAMRKAKTAGELSETADPRRVARFLNAFLTGLTVLLRTRPDPEVVSDSVEQAFAVFE